MDPNLDPCVYYALIRIAVDEGAFFDPEDPREPMPIVKQHFAELKEKCPLAEHLYDRKLKNNEANKIKLLLASKKKPDELSEAQKKKQSRKKEQAVTVTARLSNRANNGSNHPERDFTRKKKSHGEIILFFF